MRSRQTSTAVAAAILLLSLIPSRVLGDVPRRVLIVDAAAPLGGSGTSEAPFARITDALWAARALTVPATIAVRPGWYGGSYDATALASNPRLEPLPIVLDVPDLALQGSTVLVAASDGLPTTAIVAGTDTVLSATPELTGSQALVFVTRTTRGGVGDRVQVSGLHLETNSRKFGGRGVLIERVTGATASGNLIAGAFEGVALRAATGSASGNATECLVGGAAHGGGTGYPSEVVLSGNRFTNGGAGLGFLPLADSDDVPLGSSGVAVVPLADDPAAQGSQTLSATFSENDLSGNRGHGCAHMPGIGAFPGSARSGSATLTFTGNRMTHCSFGLLLDAGDLSREIGAIQLTIEVRLAGNLYGENFGADLVASFSTFIGGGNHNLTHSIFDLTISDSPGRFIWENRVQDGKLVLDNTLIVNGVSLSGSQRR
jgi:hypothetical protein